MLRYTLTKYIKLDLLRKTVSHIVELFPQIQKPEILDGFPFQKYSFNCFNKKNANWFNRPSEGNK